MCVREISRSFDDVFCLEVKKKDAQFFYCWTMLQVIFPRVEEVTIKCSSHLTVLAGDMVIIAALKERYKYLILYIWRCFGFLRTW